MPIVSQASRFPLAKPKASQARSWEAAEGLGREGRGAVEAETAVWVGGAAWFRGAGWSVQAGPGSWHSLQGWDHRPNALLMASVPTEPSVLLSKRLCLEATQPGCCPTRSPRHLVMSEAWPGAPCSPSRAAGRASMGFQVQAAAPAARGAPLQAGVRPLRGRLPRFPLLPACDVQR